MATWLIKCSHRACSTTDYKHYMNQKIKFLNSRLWKMFSASMAPLVPLSALHNEQTNIRFRLCEGCNAKSFSMQALHMEIIFVQWIPKLEERKEGNRRIQKCTRIQICVVHYMIFYCILYFIYLKLLSNKVLNINFIAARKSKKNYIQFRLL